MCRLLHKWRKPSPTEGKPMFSHPKGFRRSDTDIYPLCGIVVPYFQPSPFFLLRWILGDFYQICLHSRLPPCLRLSVRRISHFRSRCKVNSGIGWKCRVKPPVSAFRVLLCNVLFPFHSWRSDGRSCP